jgi:hypothetical protein
VIGGILVYGFFMRSRCVIGVLWPCVQALDPTSVAQMKESFRAGDFGVNVLKKPSLLAFDRQTHLVPRQYLTSTSPEPHQYLTTSTSTVPHQYLTSTSPVPHQYLTSISPVSHQYYLAVYH